MKFAMYKLLGVRSDPISLTAGSAAHTRLTFLHLHMCFVQSLLVC